LEIYGPKELAIDGKGTGKYHYCYSNSRITIPVGNCADGCLGHSTPEEAIAHQRQYELDNEVTRHVDLDSQKKCAICEDWTTHRVTIGHNFPKTFVLCLEHDTPGNLKQLYISD
jgi:hypothetical protein